MFLELIATFAAGIGAAGLVLAINLTIGRRLPKWFMPLAAGAAMIGVAISNEYTWGGRTADGLPEGVVVIDDIQESRWYRPWSYVWPQTVRLTALDTAAVASLRGEPDTAFEWLNEAYEQGFRDVRLLELDPALDSLRDSPRYSAFVSTLEADLSVMAAELGIAR